MVFERAADPRECQFYGPPFFHGRLCCRSAETCRAAGIVAGSASANTVLVALSMNDSLPEAAFSVKTAVFSVVARATTCALVAASPLVESAMSDDSVIGRRPEPAD